MATNFPTSLDNFTNPVSGNTLDSPSHSLQHSDNNDAIEAIEAKLGVGASPAGSATAGQVLTISAAGTSGWSTPVRDGLVQIVPTSVAVGSGSGSVDANGNVTFSGASSISLNGCFNSTYEDYRIVYNYTYSSTSSTGLLRFRTSGSDNSASTYAFVNGSLASAYAVQTRTTASGTSIQLGHNSGGSLRNGFVEIYNPFATDNTFVVNQHALDYSVGEWTFGGFYATTSFDGFTFYPSAGNYTGTIRVYGYRN